MLNLTFSFLASFLLTLGIIRYDHIHEKFTTDHDLNGVQKFHVHPVPRIGGVSIFVAFFLANSVLLFRQPAIAYKIFALLACGIPAFASGLIEDITKRVSPRIRLTATLASAFLAILFLDIKIIRLDATLADNLLHLAPIAILITIFAVAGLANAVNIIDGFNGLASMVSIFMLLSLGYVAFKSGDSLILTAAILMIGSILGFFFWNFPNGLIFLGDGGAYFIGFIIAELSIWLVMRNPQVSAWYPVLMLIYPIFETIFSIYRKKFVRGISPGIPDGVHLHMLIYKRLMRWTVGDRTAKGVVKRNSLTSPYLWLLCLTAVVPATIFWDTPTVLILFIPIFSITYIWLYTRIIRFKTPRWLIVSKGTEK